MFGFREGLVGFPGLHPAFYGMLQRFQRIMKLPHPEVLKTLMSVVAILGEMVATMAGPDGDKLLALYPGPLHEELRTFSRHHRDTLDHGNVTSLGQQGVTPLNQALAAMRDTWADVRAVVSTWQERVAMLYRSWHYLAYEAARICFTFEDKVPRTDLVWYLEDEPVNWGTATDNLMTMAEVLSMVPASAAATKTREEARRERRVKEFMGLLYLFADACRAATKVPMELQEYLKSIKDALKWTQEASPYVPVDLVDAVDKFDWLWEDSTCLARDHLLGTLGKINALLLSPCGGSSGPVGPDGPISPGGPVSPGGSVIPGGPGGHSVAKRCQETIEDTPGPCKEQRTAPLCGETRNGSSMTGTPEQPEETLAVNGFL
ncbi:hypothetical protein HGM15179_017591 [Zosterops borbonicus]|uniref:Uncharacterized protein n=1 Tax=Zosterops borbonicus TaxID=364589 RepID=A0A8K1G0N4_9PASS|nr:hypothetical protein HGM15179_017591 [Zosterops borbonicus]